MHVKATWRSWHSPPTRWVLGTKLTLWALAAGAIIHWLLTLAPFFLYIGDLWFCCWCCLGLEMQPRPVAQASLNLAVIFPRPPPSAAIAVMRHTPAVHRSWELVILFMCASPRGVLVLLLIPRALHIVSMLIPSGDWLQRCPLIRPSSRCCFPCYAEDFQFVTPGFPATGVVHKALESSQTVCVYSTLLLSSRRFSSPHRILTSSCELHLCNVRDRDGDALFFTYGYPVSSHRVLKSLSFLLHIFVMPLLWIGYYGCVGFFPGPLSSSISVCQ